MTSTMEFQRLHIERVTRKSGVGDNLQVTAKLKGSPDSRTSVKMEITGLCARSSLLGSLSATDSLQADLIIRRRPKE